MFGIDGMEDMARAYKDCGLPSYIDQLNKLFPEAGDSAPWIASLSDVMSANKVPWDERITIFKYVKTNTLLQECARDDPDSVLRLVIMRHLHGKII